MRKVVVGSLVALAFTSGLFVSQVEARYDNTTASASKNIQTIFDTDTNKKGKWNKKQAKWKKWKQIKRNRRNSVPIPGTLLLLGGGLAGLAAWRARQRTPQA